MLRRPLQWRLLVRIDRLRLLYAVDAFFQARRHNVGVNRMRIAERVQSVSEPGRLMQTGLGLGLRNLRGGHLLADLIVLAPLLVLHLFSLREAVENRPLVRDRRELDQLPERDLLLIDRARPDQLHQLGEGFLLNRPRIRLRVDFNVDVHLRHHVLIAKDAGLQGGPAKRMSQGRSDGNSISLTSPSQT